MSTNENTLILEDLFDNTYDGVIDLIDKALKNEIFMTEGQKRDFVNDLLDSINDHYIDSKSMKIEKENNGN